MVEPLFFERIYGPWWDRSIHQDGKAAVCRKGKRYLRTIGK